MGLFYFYNDFLDIFLKNIITVCIDIWIKLMMSMLYNIQKR